MRSKVEDIRVSYADFLIICNVQDPDNWAPWLKVTAEGVWLSPQEESPLLLSGERACLAEHPDGDVRKPVLLFPCSMGDLKRRLYDFFGGGFIDPFVLAEFVTSKLSGQSQRASKAGAAQTERHAKRHVEVLKAAVAVALHYPPEKKTAAALVRQLEEKARLFWRDTGEVPLKQRTLSELLGEAITLPKK